MGFPDLDPSVAAEAAGSPVPVAAPEGAPVTVRYSQPPAPPSERRAWLLALVLGLLGVAVLGAVLSGAVGQGSSAAAPPVVLLRAQTPVAGQSRAAIIAQLSGALIIARPTPVQQRREALALRRATPAHITTRWIEGFYPIYSTAQSTFAVNWLLLASIHMQESAFSTAPSTYSGLNFAHCCGGPMQFNVTNGPTTTWDLVANSYIYGRRPASYDHETATHPSIYDDFDAIMAAAHLLSADGAGAALDGSAWAAAYDYYGHDATGVSYADHVVARAISWSQHGFCPGCATPQSMIDAVHGAYGAPVLEALNATPAPRHASDAPPAVPRVAARRRPPA